MRGAVWPRVLAVAAAAIVGIIALGVVGTVAVWGFRNGPDESATSVGGWLLLLWLAVGVAITMVVLVALAGVRSLRRPMEDLSRAADRLQVERLPAALREIEAGVEPAPPQGLSAPPELEGVAGALENLERFVHYHAKRAQRADRDLGALLTGAADRAGARARLAEGIDLGPPASTASISSIAPGLHRDEDALRALVPEPVAPHDREPEPSGELGLSIANTVTAAAQTTLRPPAIEVGELEPAEVDAGVGSAVMVVLGEVMDTAIGADANVAVHGSVQPEGYHFMIVSAIGTRGAELAYLAEALRDREPGRLPFGLRAAVQAGKRARLLVWLTLADADAQWHLLVPPDSFVAMPVREPPVREPPVLEPPVEPEVPALIEVPEFPAAPAAPEKLVTEKLVTTPASGTSARADLARLATARRLGESLADLFARLETALEGRSHQGPGISDEERTALLVDGTSLVARLQETQLCSPRAQRALLRAIDVAVGTDGPIPLAGSARDAVALPYEALAEIREHIAEAAGAFRAPSSR
jgi:hypothetical protein